MQRLQIKKINKTENLSFCRSAFCMDVEQINWQRILNQTS
jgi:hypothetical protein